MTGRIIPLRGEPHERIQALLPWFVSGRLEPAERSEVEAHLSGCPECRAEERVERRLGAEVARMPIDVEQSWARLRARLERGPAKGSRRPMDGWVAAWRGFGGSLRGGPSWLPRPIRAGPPWMGWAMLAQTALMLLLLGLVLPHPGSGAGARYHGLGSGAASRRGDLVVMFRPDMPERDLRAALMADQARLVDGPTAAGAYVLNVPAARRAAALSDLRRRAGVVMAEPIDPGGAP